MRQFCCLSIFPVLVLLVGIGGCGGDGDTTGSTGETIFENTTRSGIITESQTWRGTIDITGDVVIEEGATVTIDPGTRIRFAAGADDQSGGSTIPITDPPFPNDPAIAHSQISSISIFGGSLRAVGTIAEPIVFTSTSSNPKWGDWDSIQYNKSGAGLILQYTVIEYGYFGVQINTTADDTVVTLSNNTIRHIVTCGICGSPTDTVTLTISANDISDCGHEGLAIFSQTDFTVEENIFHDNSESYGDGLASVAVNIGGDRSTVRNNQFLRNWIAINVMTETFQSTISGNTFSDNNKDCEGFCPGSL